MPLIEKRYAEALVDVSEQLNAIGDFEREFGIVVGIFNNQDDFRSFLLNPEIGADIKKEVIAGIFEPDMRKELVNFLKLLVDKGRIRLLPGMFDEYIRIADRRKNILNMTVYSPFPLEEIQAMHIKEKFKNMYKAYSVKMATEIDRSLIGGIKVKIGDRVIDGTIRGRLEAIGEQIAGS